MIQDPKRFAPAVARNRDAIFTVLKDLIPNQGDLLEIASGSGEHAAYIAPRLADTIRWQPSDRDLESVESIDAHAKDAECDRILPAVQLDVCQHGWEKGLDAVNLSFQTVFCANMIHIAPWSATLGVLRGTSALLLDQGLLVFYGPFRRNGVHHAQSNAEFDATLKARDPTWGVRDLELEVLPAAIDFGFELEGIVDMPANNTIILLRLTAQ